MCTQGCGLGRPDGGESNPGQASCAGTGKKGSLTEEVGQGNDFY